METKMLYYFGCRKPHGHYLFSPYSTMDVDPRHPSVEKHFGGRNVSFLQCLDGVYAPPKYKDGYLVSNIGDITIISWWDTSMDKRPGSNSILIAIGFNDIDAIFRSAEKYFPDVMERQTKPERYKP